MKLNKIILTITILFSGIFVAKSQINYADMYSQHFGNVGARYHPSQLGYNVKLFQVNLPSVYGYVANSSLNYGLINDVITSEELDNDLIDDVLSATEGENYLYTGFDITPFAFTLRLKAAGKEFLNLGVGARAYVFNSQVYSSNAINLVWNGNGNKQFAGKNVNLGPIRPYLFANSEYYLAASMPLPIDLGGIGIKPGIRLRYIQSFANLNTPRGDLFLNTPNSGRYLEFQADYEMHSAIPDSNTLNNFSYGGAVQGRGFGIDLGATVDVTDNISATASYINIGSISYDGNTKTYSKDETYRFEGLNIDLVNTVEDQSVDLDTDAIESILNPDTSAADYSVPLGSQLILQGEYRIGRSITSSKNEKEYFKHHIYLTYIQGFNQNANVSIKPLVAAAYSYNLATILNVGASASIGGYNTYTFGPFVSVRAGFFRFGFGSNNVIPIIAPSAGTGIDFNLNMAYSF